MHTSLRPTVRVCVMVRGFYLIRRAICLSTILAFGLSGQCFAQPTPSPLRDTLSQRWLPTPKSYPIQPDSQAKLLSRLRDLVLNSDQSKDSNPSRLSDADIQSLKEAMKQFGGNLPDGLTADSLDAIPPDLISKALSNPELVRQAKELANQFSKTDRPSSAAVPNRPNDSSAGEIPQREKVAQESASKPNVGKPIVEKGSNSKEQTPRSTNPTEEPVSRSKLDSPGFADLMEKLQNTQMQFEKNQKQSSEAWPSKNPANPKQPQANSNKGTLKSGLQTGDGTSSLDPQPTQDMSRSSSSDSKNEGSKGGVSADRSSQSAPTSSMDIRKELERSGFGATFQRLVEDAQRSSQSSRPIAPPLNELEQPPLPSKTPNPNTDQLGVAEPARHPTPTANPNRPIENSPRPAKPDSAMSKGFQQTGKVLNDLWTQISKSTQIASSTSASPRPAPQENSTSGSFSLPTLLNAKVLEGLVVLAVACGIAFLVLRFRVRSEQERREILEAQLSPKIEEIRTRDDVVRAFHSIAKQRLQSAQTWWTCGVVTERFEHSLPALTGPIRTLSVLYEQARYFPVAHKLSSDQIEDAKLALKQCKG